MSTMLKQLENSLDGSEITSEDTSGQFHESSEMDVPQNLDNNFKSPSVKVTKKRKADDKVEQIENRMDEAFTFLKQISQTPAKSKCSLFTDLLCVKLQGLSEQKQDIAMMEIDNIMFRLKHSADQIVQPPSHYQYPSTSFPTHSPYLLNDNYSTASSSSASLQQQPSPDYISSMPSMYYDLSQNQNSSEYSNSMSSPHFQQLQSPSPTPSQHSNVGEKSLN
ncbi:uncharacterized protein LOC111030228 [Myzus persicae]|uniref:uncharacterized protein LOC111030228 n=1 Tax=Myzus persicae TaxID=13164 RepID=UPI000B9303BB|nr:uncharacterized protein LOC111030228 [Myzus persicae]